MLKQNYCNGNSLKCNNSRRGQLIEHMENTEEAEVSVLDKYVKLHREFASCEDGLMIENEEGVKVCETNEQVYSEKIQKRIDEMEEPDFNTYHDLHLLEACENNDNKTGYYFNNDNGERVCLPETEYFIAVENKMNKMKESATSPDGEKCPKCPECPKCDSNEEEEVVEGGDDDALDEVMNELKNIDSELEKFTIENFISRGTGYNNNYCKQNPKMCKF